MREIVLTLGIIAFGMLAQAGERPNVVFLLSDDQSWGDYGFMGHTHIKTPNLDRLAGEGLLYERGYVTAPLCRPSLASLASGLYPHQTGIRGNDPVVPAGVKPTRKHAGDKVLWAKMRKRMTAPFANQPSFIKQLKANGYATLQTGKWWEGNPLDHGFTDAMTHGDVSRGGRHGDEGLKIGRETMQPIYDVVDKAQAKDQPFFIWYGVFLPHSPHNAPDRLYQKYKDLAPDEPTARYWANIDWFDETCGQLIDHLKKKGLYDNTLFVYTCDNGWVPNPDRVGKYVRSKREPVEAGIRTPIFLTHKNSIKPQRDTESLASNIDVAPTILRACGIEPNPAMSGLDLRDRKALAKRNRVFVDVYEHDMDLDALNDIDSNLTARVVINGWDKLIARPGGNELYDLKSDPDDRTDISPQQPKKVGALSNLINEWLKATPVSNDGFLKIFDGKSLDGWKGKEGLWRVEDGIIVGETKAGAPIPANTFLIWQGGQVKDFEFSCQVKFAGNNSGVQYRSEVFGEPDDLALSGYQADLHPNQDYFGMLYGEKFAKRGIIAKRGQKVNAKGGKTLVEVTGKVGDGAELNGEEWNTLRIVAVGNRLIHLVNDVVTVDVTENHPEAIAKGFLGLQLHRGKPMKVEFKELKYRALTGDGAKQALDAAAGVQGKQTGAAMNDEGKAKTVSRTETNEDGITSISGFDVEKLYTVPKEMGSWVAMGVGPDGTLYACDQQAAGVFTVNIGEAGSVKVAPLALDFPEDQKPIISARGVSHTFGALWFHLQPEGFLKLWDSDGDGDFDKQEMVTRFSGRGEHGNHAIIPTADGKALYIDGGNSATLPEHSRSRVTSWDEDLLLSRMWDPRGHARGRLAPGGWVTEFDPNKKTQEVISIGYRNQYDIALNRNGDLFTYDADMEWDMGSPWYRPTRICHVVSGSDYGWRSGTGKWPTYYEDSLPPVVEVGPGSPTGMIQGSDAKFPAKYRDALFAFDWTFGTIYAVHLKPEGAGYTGELEPFVFGAPLPVTDGVIGKDGAMYFATGGRGMESHLYRVRYTGPEPAVAGQGNEPPKTIKARALRRSLEAFHGVEDKAAVAKAWPHLSSADRFLRHAARVAVESQPVESWAERVFKEQNAQARIAGAVALARSGTETHRAKLIASLLELDPKSLSESEFLGLLRAYALTFIRLGEPNAEERAAVIGELDPFLPNKSDDVNTELIRVLVYLEASSVIEKGMALIAARGKPEIPDWTELASRNERYGATVQAMLDNYPPVQEMGYALMLRNVKEGWTMKQRRAFLEFLNEAAKGSGGASFPGYMMNIRAEALANLSDEEREAIADITGENFNPVPDFDIAPPKGPGQVYTLESAMKAVNGPGKADFKHGRSMFFATSCGACHRFKGLGGSIGPDLTSLPNKFDEAYLLEAIIDPSKDISDQYGSSLVTMKDGTVHMGLVIEKADGVEVYSHDPKADPLTLSQKDISEIKPTPVSQMPPGLINTLSPKEVKDLVIYLMSGGDPTSRRYGRPKK